MAKKVEMVKLMSVKIGDEKTMAVWQYTSSHVTYHFLVSIMVIRGVDGPVGVVKDKLLSHTTTTTLATTQTTLSMEIENQGDRI